jgi:hypothetical protein
VTQLPPALHATLKHAIPARRWLDAHDPASRLADLAGILAEYQVRLVIHPETVNRTRTDRSATQSGRETVEHALQAERELDVGVEFLGFEDAAGEHRVFARREDLADVGADAALPLLFGQAGALLGAPNGLLGGH